MKKLILFLFISVILFDTIQAQNSQTSSNVKKGSDINTSKVFVGHITSITNYPRYLFNSGSNCPSNAIWEISLKEYENYLFKMTDSLAIKNSMYKKITGGKSNIKVEGNSIIISPDEDNSKKYLCEGWKVKINANVCGIGSKNDTLMVITSLKRILPQTMQKK